MAVTGAVAYLILVVILVVGVKQSMMLQQRVWFLVLGAITGVLITMSLLTQGIQLSSSLPDNEKTLKKYNSLKYGVKKKAEWMNTMWFFTIKNFVITLFTKVLSVAASTWLVLNIVIEGSGEATLVLTAIANIVMYLGFGMLTLNKAYNWHDQDYIELVKTKIKRLEQNVSGVGTVQKDKNYVNKPEIITSGIQLEREKVPFDSSVGS